MFFCCRFRPGDGKGVVLDRRRVVAVGLAALLLLIAIVSWAPRTAHEGQIRFKDVILRVEIADTVERRQAGLSGRVSLPQGAGMLFVFETEGVYGFWMVNMRFPLDIIWFDSGRRVVYMLEEVPPCGGSCPTYTPNQVARYVLEVNAGFIQSHGVALGDRFDFV